MTRLSTPFKNFRGWGFALTTVALLATGFLLPSCSAAEQDTAAAEAGAERPAGVPEDGVLARVDGEPVTAEQVREAAPESFEQVENAYEACIQQYKDAQFQAYEQGVRQAVDQRLLEAEATERGVSVDELVAAEIDAEITPVTDEEIDAFYTENQARIRGSKEQVAGQIQQYLASQREAQAREAFLGPLREEAEVRVLLEPPRAEVAADGFPAVGPADAPVTIVEFSDFECPFCSRVNPTLEQVKQNYGDKVRVVFRQFPLAMHPNAQKAAEASLCADDQGKFWELHDMMFADQRNLTVPQIKEKAASIEGLDGEAFNACLDSGEKADEVAADMAAGQQAGVSGTPALFINGRLLSGAQPYEAVSVIIDDELSRAEDGGGSGSAE